MQAMLNHFFSSSLRRQLLTGVFAALLLVMGTAAVVAYNVALHEADEIFNARLATSARVLDALLVKHVAPDPNHELITMELPDDVRSIRDEGEQTGHPYEAKLVFQLWHDNGRLLVRSQNAPDQRLGLLKPGFEDRRIGQEDWKVFVLRSGPVWVEVAEEVDIRSEVAEKVAALLASPLLVGTLVLLLVLNVFIRLSMQPLGLLAHLIKSRQPDNTTPLHLGQLPAELKPVQDELNYLFQRVADTLSRERRFTDSAAHELRTPLTALQIHAQSLNDITDEEERAIALGRLMQDLHRARSLVERMLTFSRISGQVMDDQVSELSVAAQLRTVVARQNEMLEGSHLKVALEIAPESAELNVQCSLVLFEILLGNIIENACKYNTNPELPIQVSLSCVGHTHQVICRNACHSIPHNELQKLFEPYYRRPGQTQRGHGLGLAMVRDIAVRQGWTVSVEIEQSPQEQAFFVLCLKFAT